MVNRLLTRFLGEVFAAVDAGTPVAVADSALDPLGLPMRPLALLELVGPAVAHHVAETLHAAFPDRFGVCANLARIAESGAAACSPTRRRPRPGGWPRSSRSATRRSPPRRYATSALAALAEEIRLMLDEGVVADARDIDLCMILGAGWPFHLGGVTPYLDRTGISERVTGARFLPPGVASVPQ